MPLLNLHEQTVCDSVDMRRQHSVPDLPSVHWGAQLSGSDAVKCFCWKSVCSTPYAEAEYMSTV